MSMMNKIRKKNNKKIEMTVADIHNLPKEKRKFLYENKLNELSEKINKKTFTEEELILYFLIFRAEESDPNKEYNFTGDTYTIEYK